MNEWLRHAPRLLVRTLRCSFVRIVRIYKAQFLRINDNRMGWNRMGWNGMGCDGMGWMGRFHHANEHAERRKQLPRASDNELQQS